MAFDFVNIPIFIILLLFEQFFNCYACIPGGPFGLYPGYTAPAPYLYPYSKSRASNTHKNVDASNDICLSRFSNMKLSCAEPIAQRSSITEEECHRFCVEEVPGCRSFQFYLDTGHCEIFSVRPPVPLDDFTMPLAKDDIGLDKDSYSYKQRRKRQTCQPTIVPSIGSDVFVPNPNCNDLENINFEKQMSSVSPSFSNGQNFLSDLPGCDGNSARIQIIEGIALNGDIQTKMHLVARLQLESPDVCLQLCQNNAYPDGRRLPHRCSAVTFDRETGLCIITNNTITPNGNLQYIPTPSTVYFEKVCIPMFDIPLGCEDPFYRIPQRVIGPSPDSKLNVPTLNHCIRQCINSLRQRGVVCRSVVYYSGAEWQTQNCLLHRHTRLTNPELVRSELQHEVDYVELPSCLVHGRQHDETLQENILWSEWSDCGTTTLTRSRHRNCSDCPQRNETEPCIAEKKFLQEFPDFFEEGGAEENLNPSPATRFMTNSFEPTKKNHYSSASNGDISPNNAFSQSKNFGKISSDLSKSAIGLKDSRLVATLDDRTPQTDKCDPMLKCCPLPDPTGIVRGCSVGYQINADNKREPCIPDECK